MESLNEEQRHAVTSELGPTLVLAGAGSGKTRVLTHRIAYLIEKFGAPAASILAVTFTNKAAQEMRERISRLLAIPLPPSYDWNGPWIGTFHSICARMLRTDADRLGFSRQFSIYDTEDQLALLRRVIEEAKLPTDQISPAYARTCISRAKNAFTFPDDFTAAAESQRETAVAAVYQIYQQRLRENNAMDFDDLLLLPLILFKREPAILANYQKRFANLLVDEFQDTNRAQYLWLKALAGNDANVLVVGDDDQSIYSWRGADLRNILEFEADFPECRIFRLEQNYRSTANILAAAHSVIVNNAHRMEKELWTEREPGEKVSLMEARDSYHEAQIIYDKIREELSGHNGGDQYDRSFRDFAVLYRTNAQSRSLEDVLRRNGVPYTIVGGLRFYERKEVKDILAYLRVIANPADSVSLRRIINYPLRGIGEASLAKLEAFARSQGLQMFEALGRAQEVTALSASLRDKILGFHRFISKYLKLRNELSLPEWCTALVDETGILAMLKKEGAQERIDNIRELLSAIHDFYVQKHEATIENFLELVALVTDFDQWNDKNNAVTLMTLHSAKGLEFPIVFITGIEEGLFPLLREGGEFDDLEEERRLFYVGATRAQEKLYLSYAQARTRYGTEMIRTLPSRFLEELHPEFLRRDAVRKQRYYEADATADPDVSMPYYEDESQETESVRAGRWVMHSSFGRGRIVSVEGRGENLKVTVHFDNGEQKKILVKYGNLRLI